MPENLNFGYRLYRKGEFCKVRIESATRQEAADAARAEFDGVGGYDRTDIVQNGKVIDTINKEQLK